MNEESNIKKLRETILQLAVQGKLTANWRADHPELVSGSHSAKALLKSIKAEKEQLIKEKKIKKTKESGEISVGEFVFDYPNSWINAKIVDLCFVTKLAGFEYSKHIKLEDHGEVPVIRAQNVKPNRIVEKNLKYIDRSTSDLLMRCALIKPSILMTFIGAGIGETAIFDKKERWHLAPNVAKLEPFNNNEEKLNIKYLQYYFMSGIGRKQMFKHLKSTAQPSISMGTIRDVIVVLPSLTEQEAIIEKVNSLMALCDELEKQVVSSKANAEKLMQSVLRQVFQGKPDRPISIKM